MSERYRARFVHTISVTGFFEAAGYASILVCVGLSGKADIYPAYVCSQVFTVLSPNLIQGTQYWTVGSILRQSPLLTRGRKWLRAWVVTTAFVTADVLALL